MRILPFAGLLATAILPLFAAEVGESRTPVVVELFTSEGCSSCPPADVLLSRLAAGQPISGVQVIALSEHVDYWNHLGWADPYSSPLFRMRQEQYAGIFKTESVYTPQMIVNGYAEFVGGDPKVAQREIQRAARSAPMAIVSLSRTNAGNDSEAPKLNLRIENAKSAGEPLEIVLAITEDALTSYVSGGENTGRMLTHSAVVRSMTSLANLDPSTSRGYSADIQLPLAKNWRRQNLHAVLFVQGQKTRRIVGAATCHL